MRTLGEVLKDHAWLSQAADLAAGEIDQSGAAVKVKPAWRAFDSFADRRRVEVRFCCDSGQTYSATIRREIWQALLRDRL